MGEKEKKVREKRKGKEKKIGEDYFIFNLLFKFIFLVISVLSFS